MADPAAARRILVVGAALVRDGAVLAARRTTPTAAAGRWEFPGGKVEPGESPEDALVRELAEELGCRIEVGVWVPVSSPIGATHLLRVAECRMLEGETPRPGPDHDHLRWLGPDELGTVDWLEPDRPFLAGVQDLLRRVR
jgi:8-oxo-dGTP diphosphatase